MKHFSNYIKRYNNIWIWTLLFTFVCHGMLLLSDYVGIDTAEAIMTQGSNHYFVCLNMGRQSLVFLKFITGTLLINPYVVGVLSIVLLWFSSILWTYLFSYLSNADSTRTVGLSSLIYISSVLFVETFYFKVQCTEFTIDFCLIALSLLWTIYWIESKKIRYLFASIIVMLIYMGTYQALTICYIAGAQMCFLIYYLFKSIKKISYEVKDMWNFIAKSIITFLLAFGLNQLITKLFFSKGNVYYNDLMHWGNSSVKECVMDIIKYIGRLLVSNNIYYPIIFTFLMLISFAWIGFFVIRNKYKGFVFMILDLLTLIISPAYLAIALGGNVVYRTQIIYPYLLMFVVFISFSFIKTKGLKEKNKSLVLSVLTVLVSLIIYINLTNDLRLEYTDRMRNIADLNVAMDIENRIDKLQNDNYSIPVYFHGGYEKELNPSCIYGEAIGHSMFAQDTDVEPAGYYSSIRCIAYISQFGRSYNMYNEIEKYADIANLATDMPEYPKENSVAIKDGIIIVNLSK